MLAIVQFVSSICSFQLPYLLEGRTTNVVESSEVSHLAEEVWVGDQIIDSNDHQSEMQPKEVLWTLKDIQVGNENILQYMEQQNQIIIRWYRS